MAKQTETLNEMLDRAYRASPAFACSILERAQTVYRLSSEQLGDALFARFGVRHLAG